MSTALKLTICLFGAWVLAGCGQGEPGERPAPDDAQRAGFEIKGSAQGVADGERVELFPTAGLNAQPAATATVANGSFTLTGAVAQPQMALLSVGKHFAEMILENAEYRARITDAGLIVEGGEYNTQVYGYRQLPEYLALMRDQQAAHAARAAIETDPEAMQRWQEQATKTASAMDVIEKEYARNTLEASGSPLLKLFMLNRDQAFWQADEARQAALLAPLEQALGPHPQIAFMKESARSNRAQEKARRSVAAGKPYKAIVAFDVNGKPVQLADVLAGNKLVLLEFWASWCSPCRQEIPNLKKVYAEFRDRGFEIYGLSLDENEADWRKASDQEQLEWLDLVDTQAFGSEAAQAYGVMGLPSSFLIAADGTIVATELRGQELENAVRERLPG